jgi:glycosyltransferase involved in cell wall biosynthesis
MKPGARMLLFTSEDNFSGACTSRVWRCRTYNRRDLKLLCEELHRRSETLRGAWGLAPGALALLCVGRVAAEKNVDLAVRALRAVQAVRPDARLVLVGDGPRLGSLAGLPGVVAAGLRRGEDLAAHAASGDLALVPSLTETFGNVLTEAMASGQAVVAFDYAAAAMHLEDGVSGLSVPWGDETAFVEAVVRAARDPDLRRRLGEGARRAALGLDWEAVVSAFDAVLARAARLPWGDGRGTPPPSSRRQPDRRQTLEERVHLAPDLARVEAQAPQRALDGRRGVGEEDRHAAELEDVAVA